MNEDKVCNCKESYIPEWKESTCGECGWGHQMDTDNGIIPCRRTNVTVRENWSACPAFVKK